MAITQTGSTLQFGITSTANTGTVSSTITVPSDAQIVIVGISGYAGPADVWGGAPFESMTFTKGGTDTPMVKVYGGDSNNAVEWQGAMFYLAAPDTGTNKTLKWDWYGTDTIGDGTLNFSITFWKGVDAADPVRHQAGNHSGATGYAAITTTNPLIAQTGDKIVAWCGFYRAGGTGDGAGSIDTWTNLTELTEITHNSYTEGAWATGDPTGNVLVGIASGTNVTQPNLLAVTLREAGSVQRRDGDLAHITSVKAFNGFQTILKAATFTPSNNSRVVVVSTALVPYGEAATHSIHATISGGGLTWTRHKRAYYYDSSQWASAVYIWTAPVTTGASMAVTVTYSPSSPGFVGGYGLDVFEFPDSYAVIQTFEDGGGSGDVLSGSYDGDFSTAPSSGSYLIAATSINSNTLDGSAMTPGSGWTEVSENVNTFYNSETQYVTGTTDTAVTWANLDPNIDYSWAIGAIEIGGAVGGGVSATFGVTIEPVTLAAYQTLPPAGSGQRDSDPALRRPAQQRRKGRIFHIFVDKLKTEVKKPAPLRKKRKKLAKLIAEEATEAVGGLLAPAKTRLEKEVRQDLEAVPLTELHIEGWSELQDRLMQVITDAEQTAQRLRAESEEEDELLLLLAS